MSICTKAEELNKDSPSNSNIFIFAHIIIQYDLGQRDFVMALIEQTWQKYVGGH